MRLLGLRFRHVGPFGADGVSLDGLTAGLNVICETNEFGKSTILEALQVFLYKPFSSSDKQVKSLVTDGSEFGPEGAIKFESGSEIYTLTKRFLKRKQCELLDGSGSVLATDREAEERLAQLLSADGHNTGPSGLLWVRQGASMDRVDDDGQVASRLEGELTTLVGGDRARDYLARVEAELAENVTGTGREKASGPLKLARDALTQTDEALLDAKSKRDRTHDIGKTLASVRDEIGRYETNFNPVESEGLIRATRDDIAMASAHDADLQRLIAEYDRARQSVDRAAERQAAHVEALTRFNRWTADIKDLDSRQSERTAKLSQDTEAQKNLRSEIADLEAQATEFSAARQAADEAATLKLRFEAAARDAAHFTSVDENYQALSTRLSALDNQLIDLPKIKRSDLTGLQHLSEQARQADLEMAALTTRLYLDLTPDGKGKASLDGTQLTSGSVELLGGQVLKLDGIGTLRGDDNRVRELESHRRETTSAYQAKLEQFGITDLNEARDVADLRHDLEVEQKRVAADMAVLAPKGATALQNELESSRSLAEALSSKLSDLDIGSSASVEGEDDVRQALNIARGRLDALDAAIAGTREEMASASAKLEGLRNNVSALRLPETEAARTAEADMRAGEKLTAEAEARLAATAVETARAAAPTQSLDMLKSRLARLEQVDRQTRESLEALRRKEASLQANRDAAFEGEDAEAQVRALEDRRDVQAETLAQLERRVAAQTLLRDTLHASQSRLRDAYTEPVRAELAPLLARVIPGAEANLNETLGADTVSRGGRVEDIAQLSGGTREQIAILTRLAFARLLKRGGADAPVILDDALVYADDKRRDDMFDVLNHVSAGEDGLQLIYLSCHQGATQRLGGHRVLPGIWPEDV